MGVDANIILRHNFYELHDYEKSINFVRETIENIRRKLQIECDESAFDLYSNYYEDENWSSISFEMPILNIDIELRKGYWSVSPIYRYWYVAKKSLGRLPIADIAFDIAKIFGANEAWYCDEYIDEECMMMTLEELLEEAIRQHGVKEYPYAELMKTDNNSNIEYNSFYHDSFVNIQQEFDVLCKVCGDYTPTLIQSFGRSFVRVLKDGKFNLADRESGELILKIDLDDIVQAHGCEFIGKLDDKIALFSKDGVQLTEFVQGEFNWKWGTSAMEEKGWRKFYFNDEARIRIMVSWCSGEPEYTLLPYNSQVLKVKPQKCPICGREVLPIVYGEPSVYIREMAMSGKVILGGCCITDHVPDWACSYCQTEFIKDFKN